MDALYRTAELPLTRVLARMERAGVRDRRGRARAPLAGLQRASSRSSRTRIYALAGERFLISSPKQLQQLLFEKLKLPAMKKTKTGYSTDEDVLEQLASQHELPLQILAHRRLAKLKNTYVDALPPLVNPRTGRIHPTFHQLGAATGRLSATHPNVQNIPIRSPEGVRIREAFVPAEGCRLLSADYSQVELRILAHYSGDESLIEAFRRGEDVHRRTAAEVAGIAPEAVSAEQRARAKAVNFGIIYGSSAFGLANQLGIASAEAQATIDAYFARYRGVRRFLDETIEEARREGFVRTLLGRRRYLPDLASRNRALKNAAERMAVNSVIQGTAADLIKKAMVEVDAELEAAGLRSRMILQVHDELVFEAPGAGGRGAAPPDSRADAGGVAAARTPGGRRRGRLELAGGPLKGGIAAQGAGRIGPARPASKDGGNAESRGGVGPMDAEVRGTAAPAPSDAERDRAREARRPRGVPGAGRAVPGPRLRAGVARAARRGAGTGRGPGRFSQGVRLAREVRGPLGLLHLAVSARHERLSGHEAPRSLGPPRRVGGGARRRDRPGRRGARARRRRSGPQRAGGRRSSARSCAR